MISRKETQAGDEFVSPVHRGADVILDFVFDDELLFIEIKNIGDEPAVDVKTKFNQRFTGINGEFHIQRLAMFKNIAFLAPQRAIRTFLDSSISYFGREQPLAITATLTWHDRFGKRQSAIIHHDLGIYKDILTVHKPAFVEREERG